jgi:AraC-like DNA-binding protein
VKYYFPKNFEYRLAKGFREHKIDDLHALLLDLYEKNIQNYDASPTTVHLMFDELHVLTLNAVKSISTFQKNHVQIDKYKQNSTIEEIFDYYHAIYDTICRRVENDIPRKDTENLDKAILECIDHNLLNPDLSLSFVAEQFKVSDKYVSAVFKMNHQVTYLQYIQEKRIEHAVHLLQKTSRSIEEIAQECGYTNMLTFRRNFRSVMKVNPSDYRNQKE